MNKMKKKRKTAVISLLVSCLIVFSSMSVIAGDMINGTIFIKGDIHEYFHCPFTITGGEKTVTISINVLDYTTSLGYIDNVTIFIMYSSDFEKWLNGEHITVPFIEKDIIQGEYEKELSSGKYYFILHSFFSIYPLTVEVYLGFSNIPMLIGVAFAGFVIGVIICIIAKVVWDKRH